MGPAQRGIGQGLRRPAHTRGPANEETRWAYRLIVGYYPIPRKTRRMREEADP